MYYRFSTAFGIRHKVVNYQDDSFTVGHERSDFRNAVYSALMVIKTQQSPGCQKCLTFLWRHKWFSGHVIFAIRPRCRHFILASSSENEVPLSFWEKKLCPKTTMDHGTHDRATKVSMTFKWSITWATPNAIASKAHSTSAGVTSFGVFAVGQIVTTSVVHCTLVDICIKTQCVISDARIRNSV